jgi:hypothetical protein
MPIGNDKWDVVLKQHSLSYPGREVESVHRKFAQLHRVKTPSTGGDPRCPQEVKLAKRIKEEMDLATGTFTNMAPTKEAEDEDASSFEGDNAAEGEEEELEDKVPGEFEASSVPNDDMDLLLVQCTSEPRKA